MNGNCVVGNSALTFVPISSGIVVVFKLLIITQKDENIFGHATIAYIGTLLCQELINDYFSLEEKLNKEKDTFSVIGTDLFGQEKNLSVLLLKLNEEKIHNLCLDFNQKWKKDEYGLKFHLTLKSNTMFLLEEQPKEIKVTSIAMKEVGGKYFMEYEL
jgi:hypothetical protein